MLDDKPPENIWAFTTAELRKHRTPAQIQTLVGNGVLVPVIRGVYVRLAVAQWLSGLPDGDHVLRSLAALACYRPGAVISHRSAALVHGIDLIGSTAMVTATVPAGRNRRARAGIHLYTTPLPADHVTRRYGLPVTTAARTVVDLARTLPLPEGVVAADSAIRRRLTSQKELRVVLTAGTQRRGNARAAQVIELANGLAESALESIARVAFRDCGLPPAVLQVWLPPGDTVARVDFYWPEYKTIAEVDGAMKYENPARAKAQLWRDKKLREAGFEIVHFDWREITTAPQLVAASIRAAFARGQRQSGPAA